MDLKPNTKIVFIGDSITCANRQQDPEGLGDGYVRLVREGLLASFPDKQLSIVNRGVGGDRIPYLVARWEKDVIQLNPDWVSISIGVNDVAIQTNRVELDPVYKKDFEMLYRSLIEQTLTRTHAKLVLLEPTIVGEDILSVGNQHMKTYAAIVRKLAADYQAILVPTYQAFMQQLEIKKQEGNLTTDGIHLTSTGNRMMAEVWLMSFLSQFQQN